jgi:CheY-like chemotaxis protein
MSALSPSLPDATQLYRIIHVDDEDWLLKMVGLMIQENQAFKNVTVQTFQNRNAAWLELLQADPDLLITDLRSDNVPDQTKKFGISGFEMLSLLRERDVKFPILVFSGSLSRKDHESYARQCAGQKLNISFLQKPATSEQLNFEISKHLGLNKTYAPKNVRYSDANLTKDQQAYIDGVFARAGKPSVALQLQIDELRATKTEGDLKKILSKDADVERPAIEAELLCAVAAAQLAKLKPSANAKSLKEAQRGANNHEDSKRVEKEKVKKPPAMLKQNGEPQSKQKEFFNLIKAIGIVVLLFFGGIALLSAIFDKNDTSPKIEYTIVTTTINGQFYEKEATAEDLNSEFVTFADGTRVPWSAVKSTKSTISVNELSNALNVINAPPAKQ